MQHKQRSVDAESPCRARLFELAAHGALKMPSSRYLDRSGALEQIAPPKEHSPKIRFRRPTELPSVARICALKGAITLWQLICGCESPRVEIKPPRKQHERDNEK